MSYYKKKFDVCLDDENCDRLYEYICDNFTLDGTSQMLVRNIVDYVACQGEDMDATTGMLTKLLDGIGFEEEDFYKAFALQKEELER